MVYLEAQGDSAVFSSLKNGPHPLYVPLIMLFVDCILYLLLAIYLDQVLPGKATPFPPSVTLYPEFVRALYFKVALVFTQVSIE